MDWAKAQATMDSLDLAAKKLRPDELTLIQNVVDTLRAAVSSHQREKAIVLANQLTLLGATLSEPYHPRLPVNIVRLDYYGRELEIWAARKDLPRLASTAHDLSRTWMAVKPLVIANGGAVSARRTDSLMTRLAAAKTSAEYAALATPILDVVDELELPFEKK